MNYIYIYIYIYVYIYIYTFTSALRRVELITDCQLYLASISHLDTYLTKDANSIPLSIVTLLWLMNFEEPSSY